MATIEEEVKSHGVLLARHDERITKLEETQEEQKDDLKTLLNDWGKRPTWSVSVIITGLSSLCVGLIIYILTH